MKPQSLLCGASLVVPLRGKNILTSLDDLTFKVLQCSKCKRAVEGRSFALSHYYAQDLSKIKFMFIGQNPGPPTPSEKTFKIKTIDDFRQVYYYGLKNSYLGKFLDYVFSRLPNLDWENMFLTNIVKCHIANNKAPSAIEIKSCLPFLEQQLDIVKPKIIICMGKIAFSCFLEKAVELDFKMTLMHAKVFKFTDFFVIPTLHYAYIDQQASANYLRDSFVTTFKRVLEEAGEL